jgi:DNA-binding MarR family transcriptional regulator
VDEPLWLDEAEREAWLGLVNILIRLPRALDAQLLDDQGLSHYEYSVLASLSEAAERTMRMSELACATEGSLSRLSQVVARLEKRGWVQRRPDARDGRYTLATLTDTGWDATVAAAPGHVREVRRLIFAALTHRQVTQLTEISRRINRAITPGPGT